MKQKIALELNHHLSGTFFSNLYTGCGTSAFRLAAVNVCPVLSTHLPTDGWKDGKLS